MSVDVFLTLECIHLYILCNVHEREGAGIRERDNCCQKIIFVFLGFTFASGAYSISEEVAGFSPL